MAKERWKKALSDLTGLDGVVEKSTLASLSGLFQMDRPHLRGLRIDGANAGVCRTDPESRQETRAGQETNGSLARVDLEDLTRATTTPC